MGRESGNAGPVLPLDALANSHTVSSESHQAAARGESMPAMRKALMLTTPRRPHHRGGGGGGSGAAGRGARRDFSRPCTGETNLVASESMPALAPVHDPTDPGPMTDFDERIQKLQQELARLIRGAQEYLQKQEARVVSLVHRLEDDVASGAKGHREMRRRLQSIELHVKSLAGLQLTSDVPAILSPTRPRSTASAPSLTGSSSMPKLPPARSPNRGGEYQPNWMALSTSPDTTAKSYSDESVTGAGNTTQGAEGKEQSLRLTMTKLRRRMHNMACELQETKERLDRMNAELRLTRNEVDELRLKHSNLERTDKAKSAELLDERRKNDELSKQVKEMSENLLSVMAGKVGDGDDNPKQGETSGLRHRCFKLVQQNTALQVQARLLRRQKGWAEAKARVLQNEVTQVYLGEHDRVKGDPELELAYEQEFKLNTFPDVHAHIYKPLTPLTYTHKEAVIDFLTHITHTQGADVIGFLQSSRVFSESIRTECLNGLGKEFHALWFRHRQIPTILRAVERIVHLKEHLATFESFSSEIEALLTCGTARLWVVDTLRQCMWTQFREGEGTRTRTMPLPKGRESSDLAGAGLVAAAFALQKPVNVLDARDDPRCSSESDVTSDGLAKTVLCVPVVKGSRVRVVLQALNKLQEPHFNMDTDMRVLRPLGKVAMEVLQVCEASSASSMNSKRNHDLLQLMKDFTPITTGATLLMAFERGLAELFSSQSSVLHLVLGSDSKPGFAEKTVKVIFDKQHRHIATETTEGLRGIVGFVVKRMNPLSMSWTDLTDPTNTPYDEEVDLPVAEQTIHTLPMFEGTSCVAVCQFVCPQRERGVMSDDGAYHPENTSHFRLITLFLTIMQKHLSVLLDDPDVVTELAQERKRGSGISEDLTKGSLGKKKEITAEDQRRAAILIQKIARGRSARKRTLELRKKSQMDAATGSRGAGRASHGGAGSSKRRVRQSIVFGS